MNITDKTNYTLVTSDEKTFSDFFESFENEHVNLTDKNLIVVISEEFNPSNKNILLFLEYAEKHQNNGTSFVVISKDVTIDDFPETFNIVPTLIEAEDVIEMENIQRDLGF
ncbi:MULTISPECIES: hypothetical protein [Tenacibaculum]|uniref:Uncharacterized protein n=1 Tax=Tenacibaculum mesophilum TaxID=104268 RepID=A0AAE9MM50_9FLAO|nr:MULTISPECIES: hypothetical protein [Tenacibaculum]GFD74529.1 hypothetical protein KUL113_39490 [Tenacibaculum sp. KUL113]GFD79299.1 hypothetical protein KUL118_21610 [Tenacibaculum sp. KUL118]GFD92754.1 hypothetical protein KUL154_14870 [Alteromonas sp. KUL154]GFE00773.1 hypothetical protein KUL156_33650 [Alteromonas sp. KUL156]KAF9658087.1 hypothetical protein HBA12_12820 [Tenacibaculum mesophilum]